MSAADDALVTLRDVSFGFGKRVILDHCDFRFMRGKVTAIMGPSGTGKTTLLRLISGQVRPHSGTIIVDGREVPKLRRGELYELRKRMGMLFQSGALFSGLSVFDNVAFPLREHTGLPESMIRDLVLLKLEAVGLRGARDLMPTELSGGMARRVALARAIALDPMMIMYDEPFAGLDPITMGVIMKLIRQLNDSLGLTSIIVSHDVAEVTSISDYVYMISGGKIMGSGSPQELRSSPSPWVRQFLYAEPDGPVAFHYPASPLADDLLNGDSLG
jgi:phospholipid/cholesterol/gamma-HCH transport system ATP-binding protein